MYTQRLAAPLRARLVLQISRRCVILQSHTYAREQTCRRIYAHRECIYDVHSRIAGLALLPLADKAENAFAAAAATEVLLHVSEMLPAALDESRGTSDSCRCFIRSAPKCISPSLSFSPSSSCAPSYAACTLRWIYFPIGIPGNIFAYTCIGILPALLQLFSKTFSDPVGC